MKFQCGRCNKFYKIDNVNIIKKDLHFKCNNCDNHFFINRNFAFSSSSKNSKIICENCGKSINENNKVCDSCNLILNKTHEELRIDNKDYEALEIKQNGSVYNSDSKKILNKQNMLIPGLIIALMLLAMSVYYLTGNKQEKLTDAVLNPITNILPKNKNHIETQVVIMKSGQTYYADKIEHNGIYLKITNKNGLISEVLEKNILQISKAVIDE